MKSDWNSRPLFFFCAVFLVITLTVPSSRSESPCDYWVAPPPAGNDSNPGTAARPWATFEHAAETVPDDGCTVWFKNGVYIGENRVHRRFGKPAYFAAQNPYQAIFKNNGPTVSISGGKNIVMEGFIFQHAGAQADPLVVQVSRSGGDWSEYIVLRNNIFRDSYNNDLLKIYNGARFVTVENNLFYNQGDNEQHMDVNSVTDVNIQDNIFFNDFAASARPLANNTKHFIVIKDSNEGEDGLYGSQRIVVQRNIFLNWQGDPGENFLQIGNDGKPYFEARNVTVQNNLFLGNSPNPIIATFGINGAANVRFINNTVLGNLPSKAYAARIDIKGQNPRNSNVFFCNNIWADYTGTMGAAGGSSNEFADGDPAHTANLLLDFNLYWNGRRVIPDGDLLSPMKDDAHRRIADPRLVPSFPGLVLPVWKGAAFASGRTEIRKEFIRLVAKYGAITGASPAYGTANLTCAPSRDILKRNRGQRPSFGAYQGVANLLSVPDSTFNLFNLVHLP